jgi:predicted nucleic acid-binding protein
MAGYFFDTSALVKRHVDEVVSRWVKSLVHAKAGHRLYIARITAVEVTSAITRRQYVGDLSPAQAGAILGHFRRHLAQRYRVIELTGVLFTEAMLVARKHRLRAYDAVQLAVALEVIRIHQAAGSGPVTVVSSDRDLNDAAIAEGLPAKTPTTIPSESSPCSQARHQAILGSRTTSIASRRWGCRPGGTCRPARHGRRCRPAWRGSPGHAGPRRGRFDGRQPRAGCSKPIPGVLPSITFS